MRVRNRKLITVIMKNISELPDIFGYLPDILNFGKANLPRWIHFPFGIHVKELISKKKKKKRKEKKKEKRKNCPNFPKMFVSGVDITIQAKVFILPLTF